MKKILKSIQYRLAIRRIGKKDFDTNFGWVDKTIFFTYIKINDNIKKILGTTSDHITAEYWADENKFKYILEEEDEVGNVYSVTPPVEIECNHLNNVFLHVILNSFNN